MANVINPYDQSAWSTYTPLTSQEILMPAMMMRERHDKLDEEYATINDELQKVAFIAEHESDPAVKQKYNNYLTSLSQSRDELMNKGLNSSSRRKMLDLRGRYQSEIQPINMGYQMKLKDMDNYNQLVAKDPTYIGSNPTNRTVTDYINNGLQPFAQQGISGALMTKMASDYLSPFSQELTDTQLRDLLITTVGEEKIPQYIDYIKKHGYKPGTEGHNKLMEVVKDKVMGATGVSSWASPEQLAQASGYIDLASSSTIGKEQSQVINNSAYTVAAQKQAAKEAAKAAEVQIDTLPGFNIQPGVSEPTSKKVEEVKKDYGAVINYAETGKMTNLLDKGNDYKKNLYNKAIEVQKDIKNMTNEQIDEYFKNNKYSYYFRGSDMPFSGGRKDKTEDLKKQAKALREYNSFKDLQKEIAGQQGMTVEQADAMAQSYLDNTSTMLGSIYSAASEGLAKGEEHALNATKQSMLDNNQTQVYIDGQRKSLDDIPKELRSNIVNKSKTLGHNVFNPQTGLSTAVFTYTAGEDEKESGKTFRVEVPDLNLSKRYTNSRNIMKVLRESNTYLPKPVKIEVVNPQTNKLEEREVKIFSNYQDGSWVHYIGDGVNNIPVQDFINLEQGRVKTDYYNRSLTPAQGKYFQSGQIK